MPSSGCPSLLLRLVKRAEEIILKDRAEMVAPPSSPSITISSSAMLLPFAASAAAALWSLSTPSPSMRPHQAKPSLSTTRCRQQHPRPDLPDGSTQLRAAAFQLTQHTEWLLRSPCTSSPLPPPLIAPLLLVIASGKKHCPATEAAGSDPSVFFSIAAAMASQLPASSLHLWPTQQLLLCVRAFFGALEAHQQQESSFIAATHSRDDAAGALSVLQLLLNVVFLLQQSSRLSQLQPVEFIAFLRQLGGLDRLVCHYTQDAASPSASQYASLLRRSDAAWEALACRCAVLLPRLSAPQRLMVEEAVLQRGVPRLAVPGEEERSRPCYHQRQLIRALLTTSSRQHELQQLLSPAASQRMEEEELVKEIVRLVFPLSPSPGSTASPPTPHPMSEKGKEELDLLGQLTGKSSQASSSLSPATSVALLPCCFHRCLEVIENTVSPSSASAAAVAAWGRLLPDLLPGALEHIAQACVKGQAPPFLLTAVCALLDDSLLAAVSSTRFFSHLHSIAASSVDNLPVWAVAMLHDALSRSASRAVGAQQQQLSTDRETVFCCFEKQLGRFGSAEMDSQASAVLTDALTLSQWLAVLPSRSLPTTAALLHRAWESVWAGLQRDHLKRRLTVRQLVRTVRTLGSIPTTSNPTACSQLLAWVEGLLIGVDPCSGAKDLDSLTASLQSPTSAPLLPSLAPLSLAWAEQWMASSLRGGGRSPDCLLDLYVRALSATSALYKQQRHCRLSATETETLLVFFQERRGDLDALERAFTVVLTRRLGQSTALFEAPSAGCCCALPPLTAILQLIELAEPLRMANRLSSTHILHRLFDLLTCEGGGIHQTATLSQLLPAAALLSSSSCEAAHMKDRLGECVKRHTAVLLHPPCPSAAPKGSGSSDRVSRMLLAEGAPAASPLQKAELVAYFVQANMTVDEAFCHTLKGTSAQ